jgi:hypothetical protein
MEEVAYESNINQAVASKKRPWAGYIISALPVLFLLVDGTMKLFKPEIVIKATTDLGYPESTIVPIGITLVACTILYIIPQTAVFGAILLTGYLGGAVATNVRVGPPLFTHILFPVYVASFLWVGLYLRESRLRALVPLRS